MESTNIIIFTLGVNIGTWLAGLMLLVIFSILKK